MVTRVTNQAQQANSLQNIFRITENLFKAQQEIASGKRIIRPSDDPAGIRDSLLLRTGISQSSQYVRNIDNNRIYMQASESALETVDINLIRAKELAVKELGALATSETRSFAAKELDQIIYPEVVNAVENQLRTLLPKHAEAFHNTFKVNV